MCLRIFLADQSEDRSLVEVCKEASEIVEPSFDNSLSMLKDVTYQKGCPLNIWVHGPFFPLSSLFFISFHRRNGVVLVFKFQVLLPRRTICLPENTSATSLPPFLPPLPFPAPSALANPCSPLTRRKALHLPVFSQPTRAPLAFKNDPSCSEWDDLTALEAWLACLPACCSTCFPDIK